MDAAEKDLNEAQQAVVDCYDKLARVLADGAPQLAPFEQRNAAKALAALWQVVNGLDLEPPNVYDLGV
jgi:hypothetical protein